MSEPPDKYEKLRLPLQMVPGTSITPPPVYRAFSTRINIQPMRQMTVILTDDISDADLPDPPPDTPVPPLDDALVARLQEQIQLRRDRMLDAMRQHPGAGVYAAPSNSALTPITDPAWTPMAADPWAPAVPLAYRDGALAADRSAVYQPASDLQCPRCGRAFTGYRPAVLVAPPGLPRVAICLLCLEAGDAVQPRPEAP